MSTDAIHRIIERQTTRGGNRLAIVESTGATTYRSLNARANALARVLMCAGLRHGGHALVTAGPGSDLAVMLLAVLKAGGSYTWLRGGVGWKGNPVLSVRTRSGSAPDDYLVVEGDVPLSLAHSSPNLPVMSRGCDVACVLDPFSAAPVQVPHAAIVARRGSPLWSAPAWNDDPTATGLWVALMDGQTVTMRSSTASAA